VSALSVAGAVALAAPANAVSSDAATYFNRINAERAAHGLPALTMRSDLNSVAQGWANHMASAQLLSHNPRLASQVANWQAVGENVGEGPAIADLDRAFWNSPEHRANILDRSYRDVGVATAHAGGLIWITIDFRDPMHAESSATAVHPGRTTAARSHVAHPTLRVGSRGAAVARVQRTLHVAADGVFGPRTRAAVVRFQRSHHLPATGVVNAATWQALHL
jgi:lysozyme family protein